jgi:hypothetical protein
VQNNLETEDSLAKMARQRNSCVGVAWRAFAEKNAA